MSRLLPSAAVPRDRPLVAVALPLAAPRPRGPSRPLHAPPRPVARTRRPEVAAILQFKATSPGAGRAPSSVPISAA